jgi:hypothetical protein
LGGEANRSAPAIGDKGLGEGRRAKGEGRRAKVHPLAPMAAYSRGRSLGGEANCSAPAIGVKGLGEGRGRWLIPWPPWRRRSPGDGEGLRKAANQPRLGTAAKPVLETPLANGQQMQALGEGAPELS